MRGEHHRLRTGWKDARFILEAGIDTLFRDGKGTERFGMGIDAEFQLHDVPIGLGELVEKVAILVLKVLEFRKQCLVEFLLARVGS